MAQRTKFWPVQVFFFVVDRSQCTVTSDSGDDHPVSGNTKENRRPRRPTSARPRVRQSTGSISRPPPSSIPTKGYPPANDVHDSVLKASPHSLETEPYKVMPMVYSPPPTPSSAQQQDQTIYVVGDHSMSSMPVIIPNDNYSSYRNHMKLAFIAFLCCGCLFGLVALLLAGIFSGY